MKRFFLINLLSIFALLSYAQTATKTNLKFVRNATIIIDYAGQKILVDPMFAPKGAIGSISGNGESPLVDLPVPAKDIARNIDAILLTHNHPDHIDQYAVDALDKSIKFFVQPADKEFPLISAFKEIEPIENRTVWEGITITRTNAQHGTGRVLQEMGTVSGYILQAVDQPTVYIVGDAVWTEDIYRNIGKYQPDYIIVNSGGAAMPGFEATPIIMDAAQTMSLIQESGKAKIIAVHMDVIDHCHTTRLVLKQKAKECNVGSDKLIIPDDGETVEL